MAAYIWPEDGESAEGVIAGGQREIEIEAVCDDQPLDSDGIFAVQDEDGRLFLVKSVDSEWVLVDPDDLEAEQYDIYEETFKSAKSSSRI